jgi:Fe-S-cluster containining protein
MQQSVPGEVVAAWRAAAARVEVARDLEALFDAAAKEIAQRGPACWGSGRCCNFVKTGHRLYVTGLEAAYTVSRAGAPSAAALAAAIEGGGCPYQSLNLCTVHGDKPLGCRLYFCDRATQEWQHELYERLMIGLREVHERHDVPYVYAEWRGLLGRLMETA